MSFQRRYHNAKPKLLSDATVCPENRELFARFFEYEEYKLKRQNQLRDLDESSYKTLYAYVLRFRNVNRWFNNKPWSTLTREDIKRVYDDLEDGRILNQLGRPFEDRASYYNKIFKSKPFRLAGKAELARDIIEFPTTARKDVQFIIEDQFKLLTTGVANPLHKALLWLAWDLGENIGTLLQLTANDFTRQHDPHSGEAEYIVNLPQAKLKRTRRSRSEPTHYPETVHHLDQVVKSLGPHEPLFPFGHRRAQAVIKQAARWTNATTLPEGKPPRWKDLRSGMACHLLKHGWTREEVDARLGHSPNSSALNAYISHLAIDRTGAKRKLTGSSHSGHSSAVQVGAAPPVLHVNSTRNDISSSEGDALRALVPLLKSILK